MFAKKKKTELKQSNGDNAFLLDQKARNKLARETLAASGLLIDWRRDTRLIESEDQLRKLETELSELCGRSTLAENGLKAEQEALEEKELLALIGEVSEPELKRARDHFDALSKTSRELRAQILVATKTTDLLRRSVRHLKDEAKQQAAKNLHELRRRYLAEMKDAIAQAAEVNDLLLQLERTAENSFGLAQRDANRHPIPYLAGFGDRLSWPALIAFDGGSAIKSWLERADAVSQS